MKLTINGQVKAFDSSLNLHELLASLSLEKTPVVVELNKEAIFPRDYSTTSVTDGDKLEIITIAAGG